MEIKQILKGQFIVLYTENTQNRYSQIIAVITAILKPEGYLLTAASV